MYLDLMDVLRLAGTVTERPIVIAPCTVDDIEIVQPVRGVVRATNARQSVVVTGQAQIAIRMDCSRCLQPYEQPLDLELEAIVPLSFFRAQYGAHMSGSGDSSEVDEEDEIDDETAAVFSGHAVDVLELVRQAIVLQAPIQPLCSEDCAGLPEAANYQYEPDTQWGALQNWQPKNGDGS